MNSALRLCKNQRNREDSCCTCHCEEGVLPCTDRRAVCPTPALPAPDAGTGERPPEFIEGLSKGSNPLASWETASLGLDTCTPRHSPAPAPAVRRRCRCASGASVQQVQVYGGGGRVAPRWSSGAGCSFQPVSRPRAYRDPAAYPFDKVSTSSTCQLRAPLDQRSQRHGLLVAAGSRAMDVA